MTGRVDEAGRALLAVTVTDSASPRTAIWDAWIDTAFNGELVVPRRLLDLEGFQLTTSSEALLADGSLVVVDLYEGIIDWFGNKKRVEIVASTSLFPLLGVGLLQGHKLTIDYPAQVLTLE